MCIPTLSALEKYGFTGRFKDSKRTIIMLTAQRYKILIQVRGLRSAVFYYLQHNICLEGVFSATTKLNMGYVTLQGCNKLVARLLS